MLMTAWVNFMDISRVFQSKYGIKDWYNSCLVWIQVYGRSNLCHVYMRSVLGLHRSGSSSVVWKLSMDFMRVVDVQGQKLQVN
jgi:hypothetical protein